MPRSPKRFRPRAFGSWVLLGAEGLTSLCSAAASHRSFLSSFSSFAPRHSSPATSALGLSSVPSTSPRGPLQRTALSKKLINQLFFCLQPSNSQLLVRGGLTSLCSAAASHRQPLSCRGGLATAQALPVPLRLSPHLAGGALAKNCTAQKVDKSTLFVFGYYVCK